MKAVVQDRFMLKIQLLADWMEVGSLKAVMDSAFELEQVREVHLRSQTERAVGKIVVQVRQG